MQERKNIRRLILLLILGACVIAVYFFQRVENQPLVDPMTFRTEEPARINRVILAWKGRKVDLHFDGTHWKVNDRFDADRSLIDVLFAALAQASPKRPVAAAQRDSINGTLNAQGVTVQLYEGPDLKKQFIAGGNPDKKETYFRLDSTADTYLMTIPGYRVYLAEIFAIDQNGWRDKRVFDFNWRNFKSLTAEFPKDKGAGFVIRRPDMSLTVAVEGMNEPDTSRVNTYLDDVLQLSADRILWKGELPRYDSLSLTAPVTSIEVGDIANRRYRLELFPPLPGETSVLGKAHDDLVLFERRKLFRVIKKRTYFQHNGGNR